MKRTNSCWIPAKTKIEKKSRKSTTEVQVKLSQQQAKFTKAISREAG